MNRRDFIKLVSSGAVAMTYDIDKLLWIPGEKVFFLPPTRKILIPEIDWTPYGRTIESELKFIQALKYEFGIEE